MVQFKNSRAVQLTTAFTMTVWAAPLALATLFSISTQTHAQAHSMAETMPPALTGNWQVVAVHIDSGASRTPQYRQNDPRLMGRIFLITPKRINTNTPEESGCEMPRVANHIHGLDRLIPDSMAGRPFAPERPTAADYHLALPKDDRSPAFTLQCKDRLWGASLGRDGGIQGAWMLKLHDDRLAIRWYDETILELDRLPTDLRPKASFDCSKASSPAEKAICSSIALASLDVSIANSYTTALHQLSDMNSRSAVRQLKSAQREWLTLRNKCAADEACLQNSMTRRLEQLESAMLQE